MMANGDFLIHFQKCWPVRRCSIVYNSQQGENTVNTVIELPEGGPGTSCNVIDLVEYIKSSGCNSIVIGAQKDVLAKHKKSYSLDYWLRVNCTERSDTMQATSQLVDRIVGTKLLYRVKVRDPHTGMAVNGLRLSSAR